MSLPPILLVEDDGDDRTGPYDTLQRAGFTVHQVAQGAQTLAALRRHQPGLVIARAEVRSQRMADLMANLETEVRAAQLPVVALCHDLSDAPFVRGLRGGIVAVLPEPFSARHLAQLGELWRELPSRPGVVRGEADSRGLTALVEHVRRTRRSGLLSFEGGAAVTGRAAFVQGRLTSAELGPLRGVEALVALVTQPIAGWRFEAMSGAAGTGVGVVIEVSDLDTAVRPNSEPAGENSGDVFDMDLELDGELQAGPTPGDRGARQARLLIVDDDTALRELFVTLFSKHGFQVSSAEDGEEGLHIALSQPLDAVVADLNMPRLDGWGMLRRLRDDYRTRELPVAFLSCHDDYRESLRAQAAGAEAYWAKGGRLDGLVSRLRELLAARNKGGAFVASRKDGPLSVGALGPQWVLARLAEAAFTGRVECEDGWAHYLLVFQAGRPVHATAHAGRHTAEAARAFNAFVASRGAHGKLFWGSFPSPYTLAGDAAEQLARACATLNENERRLRDRALVGATKIEVDPALYAVYTQVGPRRWLEAARLICEEHLAPREVIARIDASPVDIEEMVKDLVRRGVLTLNAG